LIILISVCDGHIDKSIKGVYELPFCWLVSASQN